MRGEASLSSLVSPERVSAEAYAGDTRKGLLQESLTFLDISSISMFVRTNLFILFLCGADDRETVIGLEVESVVTLAAEKERVVVDGPADAPLAESEPTPARDPAEEVVRMFEDFRGDLSRLCGEFGKENIEVGELTSAEEFR